MYSATKKIFYYCTATASTKRAALKLKVFKVSQIAPHHDHSGHGQREARSAKIKGFKESVRLSCATPQRSQPNGHMAA